ncbi:type II toxin-antitoxin system HicB family antitoxin [Crenothrix sp.]|uniref:type II toxin-antitoxin system HicB family antitoxin n=1 Tax=Crenothrix sp. TaxID=3100433 RepID=UPI00374CE05E
MKLQVVVHPAEEGGFWAEIPALSGCVSEGETFEETVANINEAAEGWFEVADIHDETAYLLSNPANKAQLLEAIKNVENNQLIDVEIN